MKLVLVIFFAGVLLVAAGAVAWIALDLPPVRLAVSHGFPPAGGPTGREKEIEGVRFVEIGRGYFRMGSWHNCTKGDALGRICRVFKLPWGKQPVEKGDEVPVRWVTIREAYWIAVTEVTNAQYERFDPGHGRTRFSPDDDSPVVNVSFENAKAWCAWLSDRGGVRARLPSEAEWENVCRAGSRTEYCFGDDEAVLGEYAWFDANSGGRTHPVGLKRANAWGLHDLHGNVGEWCVDTYHTDYEGAPEDERAWTEGGEFERGVWGPLRSIRGGTWSDDALDGRSAERSGLPPDIGSPELGFRPVLGPPACSREGCVGRGGGGR